MKRAISWLKQLVNQKDPLVEANERFISSQVVYGSMLRLLLLLNKLDIKTPVAMSSFSALNRIRDLKRKQECIEKTKVNLELGTLERS